MSSTLSNYNSCHGITRGCRLSRNRVSRTCSITMHCEFLLAAKFCFLGGILILSCGGFLAMFLSGFLGFVWFPSKEGGCSRSDFAIPQYFFCFVYKTAKTHSQCPTRNGTSSRFPFIFQSLSHFNELCQVKASYELLTADR